MHLASKLLQLRHSSCAACTMPCLVFNCIALIHALSAIVLNADSSNGCARSTLAASCHSFLWCNPASHSSCIACATGLWRRHPHRQQRAAVQWQRGQATTHTPAAARHSRWEHIAGKWWVCGWNAWVRHAEHTCCTVMQCNGCSVRRMGPHP